MNHFKFLFLQFTLIFVLTCSGCSDGSSETSADSKTAAFYNNEKITNESDVEDNQSTLQYPSGKHRSSDKTISLNDIPPFSDQPYVVINNNIPFFNADDYTTDAFEEYSPLDDLGRCGTAYANICQEIMPTEPRGDISQVKPSGWQTAKYDIVDGKSLYNRCHLIGFQLAGENANERNLITGTRYMNVDGMLPFENMVADYVKETGNHVLYRVTPIYQGDNPVATGVQMEGWSVEDYGDGICFAVFAYNSQPGITIDYATGNSHLDDGAKTVDNETTHPANNASEADYILNANTKKFHIPSCSSVSEMNDYNRIEFSGDRNDLIDEGYSPCGRCRP